MSKEKFNIDDLLDQLEEDSKRPDRDSNYLNKIRVNSPDYIESTITYLPVLLPSSNSFYIKLENVLEYRTFIPSFNEGKDEVWIRMLSKEYYGFKSPEEEALYDEIISLLLLYEDNYKGESIYNTFRYRRYSLIPAFIIDMVKEKTTINKKLGASLLIYPSFSPIESLHEAIQLKVGSTKSKEWLPGVISPDFRNRIGVINSKFYRKPGEKSYSTITNIELNSGFTKVVDPELDFTDKASLFDNIMVDFMGWQCLNDTLWNTELMIEFRDVLKRDLNKLTDNQSSPVQSSSTTYNPFKKN